MTAIGTRVFGILTGLALVTGCDTPDDDQFVEPAPLQNEVIRKVVGGKELVSYRAIKTNGLSFNGISFNGISFNGVSFNGPNFDDWHLNEVPDIIGLEIGADGTLSVVKPNGKPKVSSSDKIKVKFVHEGVTYQVKISELEDGVDLQFMRVQWRVFGDPDWIDTCFDVDSNPVKAVLLTGGYDTTTGDRTNNPDELMWACRGTSIAKATELGYSENDPHHEALVRAFRADYCGDGTGNTTTGTPIDLGSNDGLLTHETTWAVEAAWSNSGAICLNNPRKTWLDPSTLPCEPPPCTEELLADPDALIVTRATPT